MKTLWQYTLARFGRWAPKVGETYRPDKDEKPNPFDLDSPPFLAKVTAVQDGFVQYQFLRGGVPVGPLYSADINAFAAYWLLEGK